jgi:hypothetical protein
MVFARTHGLTTTLAQTVLLSFMLGALGLTILLWPVTAIVRRHFGQKLAVARDHHRLRLITRLVVVLQLIFFIARFAGLSASDSPFILSGRLVPWVAAWETLGIFGAAGAIFIIYYAARCWIEGRWVWTRVFEAGIALAGLIFIFIVLRWNMINFHFHY